MFVVMDTFNAPLHAPQLCTDDDGDTRVFDTHQEADEFGKEYCQSYQVVPVGNPAVYIAVEGGQVTEVIGNTVVAVEVFDFDRPSFETEADKEHFAEKEAEWDELKKTSVKGLY